MPNNKVPKGNTSDEHLAEVRDWYNKNQRRIENYEAAQSALQLLDYTKSGTSRTYNTFSKELLRTYMQNPLSYYDNLRQLSRFLYYRSPQYRRLVWYNATAIDLNARSVIPIVDITQDVNDDEIISSYYETLKI